MDVEISVTQSDKQVSVAVAGQPVVTFQTGEALALKPVSIAKPWGAEIWYTGIEARGVSEVELGGRSLPISWLFAACPELLGGVAAADIILLKILAPLAEPVYGDLYLELHEQKREVYVITGVDASAWPEGTGYIRMGLADQRENLKSRFLDAIQDYEVLRRLIDDALDQRRLQAGIALDSPLEPSQLKRWLAELELEHPEWMQAERQLREEMNRFTELQPLRPGDVVKVPTHTPHALQHGVRAVEFQTPVYERLILSYAQKVLTQNHWNSAEAIEKMVLQAYQPAALDLLSEAQGCRVERVVRFDDFEVCRYTLESGASVDIETPQKYALLMGIAGKSELGSAELQPEQALLIPGTFQPKALRNDNQDSLIFLFAYPL